MKKIFFVLVITLILLSGCGGRSAPPPPAAPLIGEQRAAAAPDRETLAELEMMSRTEKNQVFTTENGAPEYLIGPGDVLVLTAWTGTKPETYETTVRPDGAISYSFLDDIPVAGLTTSQVDEELSRRLTRYVKKVRIDVFVKKYVSKSALLFGAINLTQSAGGKSGPGKYVLKGRTTVLDLIVGAGGATKDSDLKNVELTRGARHFTLNLYNAMFKGDMTQNVILDDGDIVTVPELPKYGERVYVFGEVKNVGIYSYPDTRDLLAAIGRAGGCTPTAVRDDIKIIRGYGEGKPVVLTASLDDIFKKGDAAQNIALANGDVVYVPRTIIGDINEFIVNTTPLLNYLFYPSKYQDAYSNTLKIQTF